MRHFILIFGALLISQNAFSMVVTVCNDFGSDGKSHYTIVIENTEDFGIYRARVTETETNSVTKFEVSRQHFRTDDNKQPDSVIYFAKDSANQIGFKLAINTSKPLEYEVYSSILSGRLNTGYLLRHLECGFFYRKPKDFE